MHTARPHLAVSQRKACHYFVSESCFRPAANKSLISLHHVKLNHHSAPITSQTATVGGGAVHLNSLDGYPTEQMLGNVIDRQVSLAKAR